MDFREELHENTMEIINAVRLLTVEGAQMKDVRCGRVSKERALELLGKSETWLKQKVKAGVIVKLEDGWYDEASIKAYFRNLKPTKEEEEIDIRKPRKIKAS